MLFSLLVTSKGRDGARFLVGVQRINNPAEPQINFEVTAHHQAWDYWYGLEAVTLEAPTINNHIELKVSSHFDMVQLEMPITAHSCRHFIVKFVNIGVGQNCNQYQRNPGA